VGKNLSVTGVVALILVLLVFVFTGQPKGGHSPQNAPAQLHSNQGVEAIVDHNGAELSFTPEATGALLRTITVDVDSGTFPPSTPLSIRPVANPSSVAGAPLLAVDISAGGAQPSRPVRLEVEVDLEEMERRGGLGISHAKLYRFDETAEAWLPLPTQQSGGNTLRASTEHFSNFGVFTPKLSAPAASKASDLPPVLLVHGFQPSKISSVPTPAWGEEDGTWAALSPYAPGGSLLAQQDSPINVYQLDYYTHRDIREAACELSAAIEKVIEFEESHSGKREVQLVAHSMGGLVARAYLQGKGGSSCPYKGNVYSLATLGTPHGGAAGLALPDLIPGSSFVGEVFLEVQASLKQMTPGSDFLRDLNGDCLPDLSAPEADYLALQGTGDLIVPPPFGSLKDHLTGSCGSKMQKRIDERSAFSGLRHFLEPGIAAVQSEADLSFGPVCEWVGACGEMQETERSDTLTLNGENCGWQTPDEYWICLIDLDSGRIVPNGDKDAMKETEGAYLFLDLDPEIGLSRGLVVKEPADLAGTKREVDYPGENPAGFSVVVQNPHRSTLDSWEVTIVKGVGKRRSRTDAYRNGSIEIQITALQEEVQKSADPIEVFEEPFDERVRDTASPHDDPVSIAAAMNVQIEAAKRELERECSPVDSRGHPMSGAETGSVQVRWGDYTGGGAQQSALVSLVCDTFSFEESEGFARLEALRARLVYWSGSQAIKHGGDLSVLVYASKENGGFVYDDRLNRSEEGWECRRVELGWRGGVLETTVDHRYWPTFGCGEGPNQVGD